MQPVRARDVRIIVDGAARNLNELTRRVVKLAGVDVEVVSADTLESDEVSVFGDRGLPLVEEFVQTLPAPVRRIRHNTFEEPRPRLRVEARVEDRQQAIGQRTVRGAPLVVDRRSDHFDQTFGQACNTLGNVDQVFDEGVVVLFQLQMVGQVRKGLVRGRHAVHATPEEDGNALVGCVVRKVHRVSLFCSSCASELMIRYHLCVTHNDVACHFVKHSVIPTDIRCSQHPHHRVPLIYGFLD